MKYTFASFILFLGISFTGYSQVRVQKIGDNPTNMNPQAVLDIESTNKGVLMPRVQLTSTISPSPLASHVKGMIVYNTQNFTDPNNSSTEVKEGFYMNNGSEWVLLITKNNLSSSRSGDLDMKGSSIYNAAQVQSGVFQVYDNNLHTFYNGNDVDAITVFYRENNVTKIADGRTGNVLFTLTNSSTGDDINANSGSEGRVGISTDSPVLSADLTLGSTNRGLLLNLVQLTGVNDVTTVPQAADNLIVFNTATTSDVTPGIYFWSNSQGKWIRSGENSANKSADGTFSANSDIYFPTQKAVKTYVDNAILSNVPNASASTLGKIQLSGDLAGTGSTATSPIISNGAITMSKIAQSGATAGQVLKNNGSAWAPATLQVNEVNGAQSITNLSNNVATNSGSTSMYPSVAAVESYVTNAVTAATADATTTTTGKVQLAGDLGGAGTTAAAPQISANAITSAKIKDGEVTTADLANASITNAKIGEVISIANGGTGASTASQALTNLGAEGISNKDTDVTLGGASTSDSKYPSQKAVKSYVDNYQLSSISKLPVISNMKVLGNTSGASASPQELPVTGTNNVVLSTNPTINGVVLNGTISGTAIVPVTQGGSGANMSTTSGYVKQSSVGAAFSTATTIPVSDVTGAVQTVNGNAPDANGNVAISIGSVTTGKLADRPATSTNNGDFYVVSNDGTNNGLTYVWDGTTWHEVTPNQAATDARYVQQDGDTMNGDLTMSTGKKVVLNYVPTSGTDAVNKSYVDGALPTVATTTSLGTIQMTGDLSGNGASPTIANEAVTSAKLAAGSVTNAKLGETISVGKGGSGADMSATIGYVKQATAGANFTTVSTIPVVDVTGAQTTANVSSSISTNTGSTTMYPSVAAVESFVTTVVAAATPDATTTVKGKLKLAGDLGGTADAPTVPALANKENTIAAGTTSQYYRGDKTWQTLDKTAVGLSNVDNTSDANKPVSTIVQTALNGKENTANKSTATTLGTSDVLFPTQNAVKTYVDNQISTGIVDATTSVKGKIKLAGDLGGTADAPTVPALADKASIVSPNLTGTPTAPTALAGTNTTQIATTAFVSSAITNANTPDATTGVKGKLKLAGDLGGTADAPTVPGLVLKEPSITAGTTSQYFRGDKTWQTLDKSVVGLSNVDNTSDANKPISTATQTALDLKAPLASPALSGTPTAPTAITGTNNTQLATTAFVNSTVNSAITAAATPDATSSIKGKIQLTGDLGGTAASPTVPGLALKEPTITAGTTTQYYRGDKTWQTLDNSAVGLSNVDNTSDMNKPISTATQSALDLKAPLASPALSGVPTAPTATAGTSTTQLATTAFVSNAVTASVTPDATSSIRGKIQLTGDLGGTAASPTVPGLALKEPTITAGTTTQYFRGDKTWQTLDKSVVGLSNVDNISDLNKPISTATQVALDLKAPLASPSLTGTPTAPTAVAGTNTTQLATTAFVNSAITAGATADATTTTTGKVQLAGDLGGAGTTAAAPQISANAITSAKIKDGEVTTADLANASITNAKIGEVISIANGGTGASTASQALTNLGAEGISNKDTDVTLGGASTSDAKYPSQKAVKSYVDNYQLSSISKLPVISNMKVLGNTSGASASPQELPVTGTNNVVLSTNPTINGVVLNGTISGTAIVPVTQGGSGANMSTTSGYVKQSSVGAAFSTATTIPVSDVTGAVQTVNGNAPDANGNVAISIGSVTTGKLADRPATSTNNGDFYVVSNDGTNNGLTYVWDGTTWHEVTPNQAATDARYVQQDGDTMNGDLTMSTGKKVVLNYVPTSGTDAVNKSYVDGALPTVATTTSLGTIQMTGDLTGNGSSPLVANSAITTAKLANGAVTNAKIGETVTVSKGGTGATTLTGYVKGNGTLAMTAESSIPVVDVAGAQTTANVSSNIFTNTGSTTMYPSVAAVESYVTTAVTASATPDATTTVKGKLKLAGDLGGTADAPTVPSLALKAPLASPLFTGVPTSPTATAGTNTTQIATTAFVSTAITNATTLNATTTATGKVQLAGDLGGTGTTAAAPVISANAITSTKIANSAVTTAKLADASVTNAKIGETITVANGGTGAATLTGYVKGNGTAVMTAAANIPVADVTGAQTTTNLSSSITTNTGSTTMYPSVAAVESFVTAKSTIAVSSSVSGIVNNTLGQELGGVDKKINGVEIGRGGGNITTNMRLGSSALSANTAGTNNTALGINALVSNTTGNYNLAIGDYAGSYITTGSNNIAIGPSSGSQKADGTNNISIGANALRSGSSSDNVAIGNNALNLTSGIYNVAVGNNAGQFANGTQNTFVGRLAGRGVNGNSTGGSNTFIGNKVGSAYTTGSNNIIISTDADVMTTGSSNTIVGHSNIVEGNKNVVLGGNSLSKINLPTTNTNNSIAIGDGDGNIRLYANASGNIGIGTTAPSEKLEVSGSIKQSGVTNALLKADANGKLIAATNSDLSSVVSDATTTSTGKIQLSGDLGGTGTTSSAPVISANAITSAKIADGSVATPDLAAGSVTNAKIGETITVANGGTGAATLTGYVKGNGTSVMTATANIPVADVTGAQTTTNVSSSIPTNTGSTTMYPSVAAVESFVSSAITTAATPNATTTLTGKVQLAGDLGGVGTTALAPVISSNAITSTKIADAAVTTTKIASGGNSKILTTDATGVVTWSDNSSIALEPWLNTSGAKASSNIETIYQTGKVGIGVNPGASATAMLTVKGTNAQPATSGSTTNATFRIDGNSNHSLDFGTQTNTPYGAYVQSVDKANLGTGLPLLLNPVGGNIGIGTTSPGYSITLGGGSSRTVGVERNPSSAVGSSLTIQSGGSSSGGTNLNGGDLIFSSGTSTGTGSSKISFKTSFGSTSGTSDAGATEKVTILGDGRVGIGTNNPSGSLTLYGDSQSIPTNSTYSKEIVFGRGGAGTGFSGIAGVDGGTYGGGLAFITKANGTADNFSGTATESMRLTPAGNLGIGTTSPGEKLEVAGSIKQSGVTSSLLKADASGKIVAASSADINLLLETEEFTATAAQTSFTLSNTPRGRVIVFRNGVRLPMSSISVSAKVVTYNSTNNSSVSLSASDRITIDYIY